VVGLCLIMSVLNSTPLPFVNRQVATLLPVEIFNKFLFKLQYLFAYFSTVVLNTSESNTVNIFF